MKHNLEKHFEPYRDQIVGTDFEHPFAAGNRKIVYADWAASGRLYAPIEKYMLEELGPYVANTHTETTLTGTVMTHAYHQAHDIIKRHINATENDVLLFAGSGMTAAVCKFQRILGLRVPEQHLDRVITDERNRPLVIVTHMEHHSNHTSWVETLCEVAIIRRGSGGLPDLDHLREILQANRSRDLLIGSFTACSNVTGIMTPYHEMAAIMHEYGGYCFVDYSASAPYVEIDMHPENPLQQLDAIFFSPHKFLGGPGSAGVIAFDKKLYRNRVPDQPGGGTVAWTNPWGQHHFFEDIEVREDGGTPGFLQGIKAALAVLLKEEMGIEQILAHEHDLMLQLLRQMRSIPSLTVLEGEQEHRLGFVSFYVEGLHHNLIVRLLNDRFGIQTRGGCSCAGTYGHVLLQIGYDRSKEITDLIDKGDLSQKPGWVRASLHPTMTSKEVDYIVGAIEQVTKYHKKWQEDYAFNPHTGDFEFLADRDFRIDLVKSFRVFEPHRSIS